MKKLAAILGILLLTCAWASAEGLERRDTGDEVEALQERLIYLGFLAGEADGNYGPATSAAVEAAKEALSARYGLDISGGDTVEGYVIGYLFDDATEYYINDLDMGSEGAQTTRLQRLLSQLGYLQAEDVTGTYDQATWRAVYAFQMESGLNACGVGNEETQTALSGKNRKNTNYTYQAFGDNSDAVKAVQTHLWNLGYLDDVPDGMYGADTQAALGKYVSDVFGPETNDAGMDVCVQVLAEKGQYAYTDTLSVGDEGENVLRVMRLLSRYGYYDGEMSESLTSDCQLAISYFQQSNHLPLTGTVDQDTQHLLFSGRVTTVEKAACHTLYPGDSSDTVRDFQTRLIEIGFMRAPADGIYGSDTEEAANSLLAFLSGSGYPSAVGWSAGDARLQTLLENGLSITWQKLAQGDSGSEVSRLQTRLNSLGYISRLKIDGKYGADTQSALLAFQTANGLRESGTANPDTLAVLYSKDAVGNPTSWRLYVSIAEQKVYAYQRQENGSYTLMRTMICSTGLNNATPRGVFIGTTGAGARWHYFADFNCWAQYTFYIEHDVMFHSVLFSMQDESTLRKNSVSALGYPASHGCVRLSVEDAKWIYSTCPVKTVVTVY